MIKKMNNPNPTINLLVSIWSIKYPLSSDVFNNLWYLQKHDNAHSGVYKSMTSEKALFKQREIKQMFGPIYFDKQSLCFICKYYGAYGNVLNSGTPCISSHMLHKLELVILVIPPSIEHLEIPIESYCLCFVTLCVKRYLIKSLNSLVQSTVGRITRVILTYDICRPKGGHNCFKKVGIIIRFGPRPAGTYHAIWRC